MPAQFECSRTIELPAQPDQVWAAVATSAGNASWLFPNDIDPERVRDDPNTVWDPPRHFAVRTEQGEWFNALDFLIEPHDDSSVLQYRHTGVFFENEDTQQVAIQQHTDFYLHTLAEYLRYFSPRTATYIGDSPGGIQAPQASAAPNGFDRLKRALGVTGDVSQGDRVHVSAPEIGTLDSVVDYLQPNFVGIRTADGLYRFFGRNAFGGPVGMTIHLFGNDVDVDKTTAAWHAWLSQVYG